MELMCTGQVECKWVVKSMQLLRINVVELGMKLPEHLNARVRDGVSAPIPKIQSTCEANYPVLKTR